jgi:TolB-like protein
MAVKRFVQFCFLVCIMIFTSCTQESLIKESKINTIACKIASRLPVNSRIVILDFHNENNGKVVGFSNAAGEMLIAGLFRCENLGLSIIERKRLNSALDELKLTSKDLFDQSNVKRIGKFLNADYVVVGSVVEQSRRISIYVKTIDVETLALMSSYPIKIKNTEFANQVLLIVLIVFVAFNSLGFNIVTGQNDESGDFGCFTIKLWLIVDLIILSGTLVWFFYL